jgi:hypothetical protein
MEAITNQTTVWVYVTNLASERTIMNAAKILNAESAVLKWTVDSEDIDNVLRIETITLKENYIPELLAKQELACVPMLD